MLAISVNKEFLDLGKISITFELLSPVFNEIGSFSYPFSLPATPRNNRILSHPGRINNAAMLQSFDAEIHFSGMLWKTGKLFIRETTNNSIKANFTVGEGYFSNAIKNTRVKDIDLGGTRFTANYGVNENVYSGIYLNQFPDVDFAIFEISNTDFWNETQHELYFRNTCQNKVNYWSPSLKLHVPKNTFVFYPYVNYLIQQIFQFLGVDVINDIYDDSNLKNLCIYSNNPQNDYWMSGETFNMVSKISFRLNDSLPAVTIGDFFKAIENTFSMFLFFNESTNRFEFKYFKSILNDDPFNLDCAYKFDALSDGSQNGYSLEWQNDDNDELLKKYKIDISSYNYLGDVYDYSDLPDNGNINDLYFVRRRSSFYSLRLNSITGTAWRLTGHSYNNFVENVGELNIKPQGSLGSYSLYTINSEQKKGNHTIENEVKDFPVKFLIYRGMVNGKPLGSTFHNLPYSGPYSLHWHGPSGLYENFWKEPLRFYENTRKGEFRMVLSPAQIKNLDFSKKYRFADANWLLSSVKIQVSNDKISPATVVAYKV